MTIWALLLAEAAARAPARAQIPDRAEAEAEARSEKEEWHISQARVSGAELEAAERSVREELQTKERAEAEAADLTIPGSRPYLMWAEAAEALRLRASLHRPLIEHLGPEATEA